MYFASHSRTHGDLYVPAFTVALGSHDRDMLTTHGLAATSVSVDLALSMSGTFKFSIPNTFDAERSEFLTRNKDPVLELLTLGKRVWIRMGYGDKKGQKPLLSGYITAVGTGFAEGGSPTLEVSGVDSTYLLTLGTQKFQSRLTVEEMVSMIARQSRLRAKVEGAPGTKMLLGPDMESGLAYLRTLAAKFSSTSEKFEFYARATPDGDELHFRPRQVQSAPVGTLTWGVDLLGFDPEFSIGEQVSEVRILSWDEVAKKKIVGRATREPAASGGTSGGALQKKLFGDAVLELYHPVRTQQEADDRAASELAKRAQSYVGGSGETFGFPALLPDTVIALEGLGKRFSKTFYVSKTVHRFDSSGYRTRFTVERTAI
jgi:Bacteriophage probable baseplate hub protein